MVSPGIILVCVLVPLLGALVLPSLGRISVSLRNIAALAFVLASLVTAALMLPQALSGNPLLLTFELPLGFTFGFLADGLAVFMAMTSSLVSAIIVFYSFDYMERYANQNEYYLMVVLFIGSMMGLVFSTNLILIYTFWEISAVCCWRSVMLSSDSL